MSLCGCVTGNTLCQDTRCTLYSGTRYSGFLTRRKTADEWAWVRRKTLWRCDDAWAASATCRRSTNSGAEGAPVTETMATCQRLWAAGCNTLDVNRMSLLICTEFQVIQRFKYKYYTKRGLSFAGTKLFQLIAKIPGNFKLQYSPIILVYI